MNILNNYFDKIYCINLDRRPDRWEECSKLFEKHGLEVERFSACDGQFIDTGYGKVYNGELGGTISHTRIIKKIKDMGHTNALILEDDVEFAENFFERVPTCLKELPQDWDILFFGGNHTGGFAQVSPNLVRVFRTYALHCYAVNSRSVDSIYQNMIRFVGHTLGSNKKLEPSVAADYYMAKIHPIMNVYSVYPNITYQRTSFSDLQQDIMTYDFLRA